MEYANHPETRRAVGLTFQYQLLDDYFEDVEIAKFREKMLRHYAKLTKNWNDELNSEWIARMYLAAKMIYSATLLLNTSDFCKSKNVLITDPYLLYYSLFCCCRALNFVDPCLDWKDGALIRDNHARVINNAVSFIERIDRDEAAQLKQFLLDAKDFRELFSYKFPSNGYDSSEKHSHIDISSVKKNCILLCEIAQKSSEFFEISLEKHCDGKSYKVIERTLLNCVEYSGENYEFRDEEDAIRIAYIIRKVSRPYNIYMTMSEGLTDEFFGSWHNQCGDDDFNPDHRFIRIFEFP